MTIVRNFLRRTFDLGRQVGVLLILLHLPITLLFSLNSRLLYEDAASVFKDTALLIVLYFLLALALGAIVSALVALAELISERVARRVMAMGIVIVFGIVLLSLLPMSEKWWLITGWTLRAKFGHGLPTTAINWAFAAAFVLFAVALVRRGMIEVGEGLARSLSNGATLTVGIVAIATAITAFSGYFHRRPFGWKSEGSTTASPSPAPPNVLLIPIHHFAKTDLSL